MRANFAEQEVIFRQGEPADRFYLIQAGSVFITSADTRARSDHDSNNWERRSAGLVVAVRTL